MSKLPHLSRRAAASLLGAAVLAPAAGLLRPAFGAAGRQVTDMAGRTVDLLERVERIVLLDARDILSLSLLHPDPSSLIVGWAAPETLDSNALRTQYDSGIPVIGGQTGDTVSLETILALAPDLVVATARMEPDLGAGALTRRLGEAGIPVLFSNSSSNSESAADGEDPIRETGRIMQIWGAVLGKETEARAFTSFVEERLARVEERLAGAPATKCYLELQSTYDDCCWAAGTRIWGDLLTLAGGRNLAAVDAPWFAQLSIEQLIAEAPEVYIACGGDFAPTIRPVIAPGADPAKARGGLKRLCGRTGFATLPAVRNGRVHGIWSGLVAVQPFNILFVELAAKWLHPDLFRDLEPADTLDQINRRFLAQPVDGPCWISLT